MPHPQSSPEHFSPADILALVREHLPAWLKACEAADADAIALHESEFGSSPSELLLFACAIKFAAKNGKNVYVTCQSGDVLPEVVEGGRFVAVYREEPPTKPKKTTSESARKTR